MPISYEGSIQAVKETVNKIVVPKEGLIYFFLGIDLRAKDVIKAEVGTRGRGRIGNLNGILVDLKMMTD